MNKLFSISVVSTIVIVATMFFSCSKDDESSEEDDSQVFVNTITGKANGHEWVDLGLSVKWASCNIGATSPEDYGDFFAWGETDKKSSYSWSNYKWCKGSKTTLTKYCIDGSYGIPDGRKTLEPSDDAAVVNWGAPWRMPTSAEFTELEKNCVWNWTVLNDVRGYLIVSRVNGNFIFIPAAGYWDNSSHYETGWHGGYWSSSLMLDLPIQLSVQAEMCFIGSPGEEYGFNCDRNIGRSIRPVCQ